MIFNMTGGGAPLNFKVVPNPQPDTAKENTIWVDTDRINNYYFSATQPKNMVNYDVWFHVGTSSPVEFNALKKNGIQVYPFSAKQYVGGALVDRTAKSYQGGKWVDWWNGELYDAGNQYERITGGWQKAVSGGSATIGTDSLTVSASASGQSASITTANMIDLSQFDTLSVNVTKWSSGDNSYKRCQIRILDSSKEAAATTNVGKTGVFTVNVSSLTEGYIQLYVFSAEPYTHTMTANKLWLK